ncbi:uncharacterized protein LOC134454811 [Engraulis encrasicolus]|uniref:uncharacterized protein LOC134454811 n=1 Tax=Engraulis encrasicolus TaxID=184585 RepID=UPI002FD42205
MMSSCVLVSDWLAGLRLEQYAGAFRARGLVAVGDCVGLSNEALEEMGVSLPGHRKRILGNLPLGNLMLGSHPLDEDMPGHSNETHYATPVPKVRTKLGLAVGTGDAPPITPSHAPPIPPRISHGRPPHNFTTPVIDTSATNAPATVAMSGAPGKPTPAPRPRLQDPTNKDARTGHGTAHPPSLSTTLSPSIPPSISPSPSPSPSRSPSFTMPSCLPPPLSPSLSTALPLSPHPSLSPSLSPSLHSSSSPPPLPRTLSASELYEYAASQLPPLPPKCFALPGEPLTHTPSPLTHTLTNTPALSHTPPVHKRTPPAIPRRPPAPPQRPPRTTPPSRHQGLGDLRILPAPKPKC